MKARRKDGHGRYGFFLRKCGHDRGIDEEADVEPFYFLFSLFKY